MQVKSYNAGNVGQVEFDESCFGGKVLYRTLKDAVVNYEANQRQGDASTRGRSQVKGTNAKPYRQKHTGRARAGDRKSPIWRGGGTVFGPKPRDWSYQMPRKARRVALRSALAGKFLDDEVVIADLGAFPAPSAKSARRILNDLGGPARALVLIGAADAHVWKSFRNFPQVEVRTAREVCAYEVVAGGLIIVDQDALEQLTVRVGVGSDDASVAPESSAAPEADAAESTGEDVQEGDES